MAKSSPLLELPGEIRNIIYDFTLTEAQPIIHYLTHFQHSRFLRCESDFNANGHVLDLSHTYLAERAAQECNQLKYVCHQLRRETLRYELKCNPIAFIQLKVGEDTYLTPIVQFLFFISNCAPPYQNDIRTVCIRPC